MGELSEPRRRRGISLAPARADMAALCADLASLPSCFALDHSANVASMGIDRLRSPSVLRRFLGDLAALLLDHDDLDTAASLLVQRVAARLAAPTLAVAVLHGIVLLPNEHDVHVDLTDPTCPRVSVTSDLAAVGDDAGAEATAQLLDRWHEHWIDGLVGRLIDATRATNPDIAGRRLWANAAAAVDEAFAALHWLLPGRAVETTAGDLRARVGLYRRHGRLDVANDGDRISLVCLRHSCCQHRRVGQELTCSSCPSIPAEQRTLLRRSQVEAMNGFVRASGRS